jgi:uncharacterized protein (DUF1778 family)
VYTDPKHIRKHRINLSFTDVERGAIEAVAELNGTHPSAFVREVVLSKIQDLPAAPSVEPKQQ